MTSFSQKGQQAHHHQTHRRRQQAVARQVARTVERHRQRRGNHTPDRKSHHVERHQRAPRRGAHPRDDRDKRDDAKLKGHDEQHRADQRLKSLKNSTVVF